MFVQLKSPWKGKPVGERLDVSDDDADLLVKAGLAEKAPNVTAELISEAVAKAVAAMSAQMSTAMDAMLKEFVKAAEGSRKNGREKIFGPAGDGDPKGQTFGKFLIAVFKRDQKTLEDMGSQWTDWTEVKAQSSQTGAQGGFTVPEQFLPRLLQIAAESTFVGPRCTRIPQATKVTEIPSLDQVTPPTAGETRYFGGIQANWTEEAAALGEEDADFKQLRLENFELSGFTYASNTLLADSAIGLEALLMRLFGGAVGWYEEYAFLRGTGAGQPLGALTWAGLIAVTRSAASAFALSDAANMMGRLLMSGDSADNICWSVHPTVWPKLVTMADTGGNLIYIDNARQKPQMMLLGYPAFRTEKQPALNTQGDVLLGNWPLYVVGDRQQIEIAFSEHFRFTNNQGTWRFVRRVGGRPWLNDKFTLSDATNTLSPFVTLAAG